MTTTGPAPAAPTPRRRPRLAPTRLERDERAELTSHLGELRTRMVISIVAVAVTFTGAFLNHKYLIELLNQTLPPELPQPTTLGVAEGFLTSIKVSLWAGLALAFPIWAWQVWGFLAPAFDKPARRTSVAFVTAATLLFAGGVAFAWFIALPSAVQFLVAYDADLYDVQIRAKDFYTFAAAVLVSVGLVFDLPILLLGLVRVGILTTARMRKERRIAYVALTALAVVLPGVDPVLTVMELVPLMLLYEGTIIVSAVLEKRWRPETAASDAADDADASAA